MRRSLDVFRSRPSDGFGGRARDTTVSGARPTKPARRYRTKNTRLLAWGLATAWACAGSPPPPAQAPPGGLRETGVGPADHAAVFGARLFPEALEEAHGWGIEPGGGVRGMVAGLRFVSMPDGAMRVAGDRLGATASNVVALPERMGGGFLFGIGPHLWRADSWLGPLRALLTWPVPIVQVLVGLDRVYLRSSQGGLVALDLATATPVGSGPLPASPSIGPIAALDAWHAVAIADLRGAMVTQDAGQTWHRLWLPIDPSDTVILNDSMAVGGLDESRQVQWWEVLPDGRTSKLSPTPRMNTTPDRAAAPAAAVMPLSPGAWAHPFGVQPLASAIEDGWPLADGTALVARNGAIGRVRLTDGALVESVPQAFPLDPARCHALSLGPDIGPDPHAQGQTFAVPSRAEVIGFVCGEARGRTVLYRWDASTARLVELRSFSAPRETLGFGNGGLGVRGPCEASATGESESDDQAWCLMTPGGAWRETRLPGDARVTLLADGRTVLVHPPRSADMSTAHLTVIDGARTTDIPLVLPLLHDDAARALRLGVWMDGFEERRPGILGGWVDAAGALLGIEIAVNGETRVGEYIRDAGAPVASGRWGFGWTASRLGFETTNGGMTWAKLALPDPIASGRAVRERACGPVGCIAAGWLRVGWGGNEQTLAAEPVASRPLHPTRPSPSLALDCVTAAGVDPLRVQAGATRAPAAAAGYAGSIRGVVSELPPFAGRHGPSMRTDDLGVSVEVSSGLERGLRAVPLGRIYAWGPKSGDWDVLGRWQVLWQWPWGDRQDERASAVAAVPWSSLDAAGRALGAGPGTPPLWVIAEGDDPEHALLLAHHPGTATGANVFVLEAGRAAIEAQRSNGDLLPEVQAATRVGDHWYVATAESPGELAATVVWSLDGATARELVRVPRTGFAPRPAVRLARHSGGRAIALVVDGQPEDVRGPRPRWTAAINLEAGTVGTPEPLAPADLSDRIVSICTGDDSGWELDLPYPGTVHLRVGPRWESTMQAPVARMRLSRERACLDRIVGTLSFGEGGPEELSGWGASAPRPGGTARRLDATVLATRARYTLRCAAIP